MKLKFMKIFFILSTLFLFSCAQIKDDHVAKFHEQIIAEIGDNEEKFSTEEKKLLTNCQHTKIEWNDGRGNIIKSYSHSERKLGILSYTPLFSFFLPRQYENHEIVVTLKDGKVIEVQRFRGITTLESESMCNEAIFSCITAIKDM